MNSGIYKIRNTVDEKIYIGSAISFYERWKKHRSELRKGRHHSILLQRAWNKYSKDFFEFEIIEEILDKSRLVEREQYYLNLLNPEYNICKIAGNSLGRKFSEETKQKIRFSLKGKPKSEEHKRKIGESHKGKPTWNKGLPWSEENKLKNPIFFNKKSNL
jgi:group I intron endonuclease